MTEVQVHGNIFEDLVLQQTTGHSKTEYQKLLESGYTNTLDIVKGIYSDFNGSIKTTKGDGIGGGDILNLMSKCEEIDFKFIIAQWKQNTPTTKQFYKVYEFDYSPENYQSLFGELNVEIMTPFVNYVKSIPAGKEAQKANQPIWKSKRSEIQENYNTGIVSIAAKIDSKSQRRVQCGFKIDSLINSGIPYTEYTTNYRGINLPFEIQGKPRTFNKSKQGN